MEILAAGSAVDEGKIRRRFYEEKLGKCVNLYNVVDSKDLYTTLSFVAIHWTNPYEAMLDLFVTSLKRNRSPK